MSVAEHFDVRAELEEQLREVQGKRPHPRQVDAMAKMAAWLGRTTRHDGPVILRSVPQAIRGIGWAPTGTCYGDHKRYRNQVVNRLEAFITIGWVESWESVYRSDGAGVGLRIVLTPAGVAQSVRARRYGASKRRFERRPGGCAPAGAFSSGRDFLSPSGSPIGTYPPTGEKGGARERAREGGPLRDPLATRDVVAWQDRCRAALRERPSDEDGGASLEALPWLAEVPVSIVARAALELALPRVPGTLSLRWRLRLEAAARRMDRYADFGRGRPGAGVEQILNLARGDWSEHLASRPRSLGAIAVCARRLGNEWRRHDRHHRRSRREMPPQAAGGATA